MRVLHISDVHIPLDGPPRPVFYGGWRCAMAQIEMRLLRRAGQYTNAKTALHRIVADVDRLGVDHVILSGDLTTLAMDEEFEVVREALGPLAKEPGRLTVIPGNHDRYTPDSMRERRFERHFGDHLGCDLPEYRGGELFPMVRLLGERLAVVGLDSSMVPPFPGLAYGRVGDRQLEALRALLADFRLQGRQVLVALHHGPYNRRGGIDGPSHGLRDAWKLLEICREAKVAGLLHGHVHDRFSMVCPRFEVPIYGGGSSTQLGREGYWLFDLDASGALLAEETELWSEVDQAPAPVAVAVA